MQNDQKTWAPHNNNGLWISILIIYAYIGAVYVGISNTHPLLILNTNVLIGDFLWAMVTMWLCTGLFICAHDAMHGLITPKNPRLNAFVGQLCLGIYAGLSYSRLLKGHIAHHAHPSTEEDPDYWPDSFGILGWYIRFMLSYLSPLPIIIVAATYHTLHHGMGIESQRLLAMWIAPQVLSSLQLFYFGTYLPHHPGLAFDGEGLYKARSNQYPAWLSLLTCYHFGYHYEHHFAPWIPWWKLHRYHAYRRKDASLLK